jgi:hypothetical protein
MSRPARPVALRSLVVLTAAVVAAHLFLLQETPLSLNMGHATPARAPALNTRMLPAPPVPPEATPAPVQPPAPAAPKPSRPAQRPATGPAAPVSESNQAIPSVERSEPAIDSVANSLPVTTVTTPEPAPLPAPVSVAAAPPAPAAAPAPAATGVSLSATVAPATHIIYQVRGEARQLPYSASAELFWRHDGQHYDARLSVSALFLGSRTQTSEGDITPQGLAPIRFADKSRSEQAAHFNRDTGRISFSANTPDVPLLPGAQDRLSLFLQLGALLAADPTRLARGQSLTLQTAGPRDADLWQFTSQGVEAVHLPGGELQALKLTRAPPSEYDTRVEMWLAPSLHYLPVRIRITQARGDFVDQQMSSTEPMGPLQ